MRNVATTPKIVVASPSPIGAPRDAGTTLELFAVSPSAVFCATPNTAAPCHLTGKENAQPMSTAVILQRYWKLSVRNWSDISWLSYFGK